MHVNLPLKAARKIRTAAPLWAGVRFMLIAVIQSGKVYCHGNPAVLTTLPAALQDWENGVLVAPNVVPQGWWPLASKMVGR